MIYIIDPNKDDNNNNNNSCVSAKMATFISTPTIRESF